MIDVVLPTVDGAAPVPMRWGSFRRSGKGPPRLAEGLSSTNRTVPRSVEFRDDLLKLPGYLTSIGITELRDINQIANFPVVEWPDNIEN